MIKDNGGPAFSGTYSARSDQGRGPVVEMHDKGMSLRDYFAAKVLASWIIAAPTLNGEDESHRDNLSSMAYAQADSMLAERAK